LLRNINNDARSGKYKKKYAVVSGTALQVGRSPVWFPVESLIFFIYLILPAVVCPWGRLNH
jgi:hypothetical protein